jgi:spore coat protein U-like protein
MFFQSKFSKSAIAATVAGVAMFAAQSASAQSTATAPLTVTASVQSACSFDAGSYTLPFGTIVIGASGADKLGSVDVTIACGSSQPYSLGASGTVGSRAMAGVLAAAGSSLNYELYRDVARTLPLGNIATNRISAVGSGAVHTIYGTIPQAGNSAAVAGNYQEVVTLTLSF